MPHPLYLFISAWCITWLRTGEGRWQFGSGALCFRGVIVWEFSPRSLPDKMNLNAGLCDVTSLWKPLLKRFSVTKLASSFSLPWDVDGDQTGIDCVEKSTFQICHTRGRDWKCQKKAQFMVQMPKEREDILKPHAFRIHRQITSIPLSSKITHTFEWIFNLWIRHQSKH